MKFNKLRESPPLPSPTQLRSNRNSQNLNDSQPFRNSLQASIANRSRTGQSSTISNNNSTVRVTRTRSVPSRDSRSHNRVSPIDSTDDQHAKQRDFRGVQVELIKKTKLPQTATNKQLNDQQSSNNNASEKDKNDPFLAIESLHTSPMYRSASFDSIDINQHSTPVDREQLSPLSSNQLRQWMDSPNSSASAPIRKIESPYNIDLIHRDQDTIKKRLQQSKRINRSGVSSERNITETMHEKRRKRRKPCYCHPCMFCLGSTCVGLLIAGLIAALVLTLNTTTTAPTGTIILTTISTGSSTTTSSSLNINDTTTTTILTTTFNDTTTTFSTTTTTTGPACNFTTTGLVDSFGSSAPTSWTQYSYSFVATATTSILRFTSATDLSNKDWYIDDVAVTAVGGSASNLLLNGDFENGPNVGWQTYTCSSSCAASINSSSTCLGGSGFCYHNKCTPSSNKQFLEQSFSTVIGLTYNITAWLLKGGSGVGPGTGLYINLL